MITFGRKPYENVSLIFTQDADGLCQMDTITLVSKKAGKRKKETSALEDQIKAVEEAKKKQKALENKNFKRFDLLQALINDILAEPEGSELDDERPLDEAIDLDNSTHSVYTQWPSTNLYFRVVRF